MAELQIPGLAELREKIDRTDEQILQLLNQRARLSLAVGDAKAHVPGTKVYDPEREARLLEKLASLNSGPLTGGHVVAIWREIMSASRSLQKPCTVAYLGPEGTFSYFAAVDFLGNSMTYSPCADFASIFRKINAGVCDMGVVPLENSIHGTIPQSFDLFSQYSAVSIRAEFFSRIVNSLLSREDSLENVHTVYSHAQPLGQCAQWLQANIPHARLVSETSTAAAAWHASQETGAAAIGHHSMAEKLGMKTLASNIEDNSDNWTRFVLISAGNIDFGPSSSRFQQGEKKSSLLFTVADRAGALSAVLGVFTAHNVNMTKLESRPRKDSRWKYIFFADVECDLHDPAYAGLLREIGDLCSSVRVLGCYPEGPQIDSSASTTDF